MNLVPLLAVRVSSKPVQLHSGDIRTSGSAFPYVLYPRLSAANDWRP